MTPEEFKRTFNLPFNEASSFFQKKLNIPTDVWTDLKKDQHAKGFMIAGATKAELLADFRAAVQKADDGQMTLKDFQSQFDNIVARHGWDYNGGRNWRSSLIYNTNVRTAYMAGRWQQLTEPGTMMPYLVYRHADGVMHPRPLHVSWNGITLPADNPWWQTHYPPNGWGCHCKVFAAGEQERQAAIDAGKGDAPDDGTYEWVNKATGEVSQVPNGIDAGWDYNVGQAADRSYRILGEKFETLPNDIARSWMQEHVAGPAFERFVEGKIASDFPVAVLNPEDIAALDAKSQTVWMSPQTLADHLAKHPEIALADYRMIPEVLDKGEVYKQNDAKLVYLQQADKLYRAALKRTTNGAENYFLTLFETSGSLADLQVRSKLERIR